MVTVESGSRVETGAGLETHGTSFDPLKELMIAQTRRPEHIAAVNLRALSPFQRALLVVDGTVTKLIEAYTMEPVVVTRLRQERQQLPEEHFWLEAVAATTVVLREVLLRGQYSGRLFAHAASLIVPERLGEEEIQKLEVDGQGLGRILLNSRRETRREVLWYGRECPVELPDPIRSLQGMEFISRLYRIIMDQRPIMLINERFPSRIDWMPDH